MFHRKCIVDWIKTSRPEAARCPLCHEQLCNWDGISPAAAEDWQAYVWRMDYNTALDPSGRVEAAWTRPFALGNRPAAANGNFGRGNDSMSGTQGTGASNPEFPMAALVSIENAPNSKTDRTFADLNMPFAPQESANLWETDATPRPQSLHEDSHSVRAPTRPHRPFVATSDESSSHETLPPQERRRGGPSRRAASYRGSTGQPYPSNAASIAQNRRRAGAGPAIREGITSSRPNQGGAAPPSGRTSPRLGERTPHRPRERTNTDAVEQTRAYSGEQYPSRSAMQRPTHSSGNAYTVTVSNVGGVINNTFGPVNFMPPQPQQLSEYRHVRPGRIAQFPFQNHGR